MDNRTSPAPESDNRGSGKDLQLFGNVEWGVREFYNRDILTATIDGVLYYEVVGLCRLTEHSNPSMTVRNLTDEAQTITLDISAAQDTLNSRSVDRPAVTVGPNPRRLFVNREGANRIVLDSRSERARELKAWLADDVMPALEDTGRYEIPRQAPSLDVADLATLRQLHMAFGQALAMVETERSGRIVAEAKVKELEPKAEQAEHFRSADGLQSIGDFANDIKAWAKRTHGVTVKHKQVWDFLAHLKLIIRGNTIRHNHPTAFATDNDYVRLKQSTFSRSSGSEGVSASPRLTNDGAGYAWDRMTRYIAEHGTLELG